MNINMEKEDVKMTPFMKAIKAVHSVTAANDTTSVEDLTRQRNSQDRLGGLITPTSNLTIENLNIKKIPAEWIKPSYGHDPHHIILYCHGGGYTCGSLKYAAILANKMCLATGIEVISFEYRLSPENPYPAAILDAVTVWNYIMHLGYGANDVILVGDSAGGNLALELCLKLKAQKRMQPHSMVLMSPWTDMTASGDTYESCKDIDPMLTKEYIISQRNAYIHGMNTEFNEEETDYSRAEFSPLFADLSGLPPTLIQVGYNEILRDDSERLKERLLKDGVNTVMEVYQDAWHVFQMLPSKKANAALESMRKYIWESM